MIATEPDGRKARHPLPPMNRQQGDVVATAGSSLFIAKEQSYQLPSRISWPRFNVIEVVAGMESGDGN